MRGPFYDSQPVDLGSPYGMVLRKDVYGLYTEDLDHAARLWKEFKTFGLPHGKGYLDENEEYVALISAFEDEYSAVQKIVMDRARSKK